MAKYYLGIDIGTFETKGVLVDEGYEVVATHSAKHDMENPRPNYFEQDAEAVWWQDFCIVSKGLLQKTGIDPKDIAGIGADVLGCDCLPVDENCTPLRKAILYGIDARASEEIAFLNQHYGPERVKQLFGHTICSDDIAPKILWVKNNEPQVYAKTYKFLTGSSYITAKLTGRHVIDQFLAKSSFNPLYTPDGKVNEKECALFCRADQLAGCLYVHDIAGGVTAKAAAETGLAEGTPVICGTGDSTSEAISVGIVKPGRVMFQFGSSLFFYYCADRPVYDHRIHGGNFTVPGTYSASGGTNTAGTLTRWMRDTLYFDLLDGSVEEPYAEMMAQVKDIPPGSGGLVVLPYFAGERCPVNDEKAKGIIFGLTLEHTRSHIYHAALEGVGYSVAQNIRVMEEIGLPVELVTAVGGGTKNPVWMQMVADILGKPLSIPKVSIGASYGCALMAALGTGALASFDALAEVIQPGRVLHPNMENHETYKKYLAIYDELYPATKALMHRL
ncbi:FGGY-family carbohydrate kinase [Ruminococcaceae bacterium OttesenSCG-928-O06]|nr:FGGY-family carbohydrate kinase [Ruminococcaceae bacterium OttesenSCG-928-O06]